MADIFHVFLRWSHREGKPLTDLLPDGQHPNSAGHALIAAHVTPAALRLLADGENTAEQAHH